MLNDGVARQLPAAASLASGALGFLALAGWWSDVEILRTILPGRAGMMPNTAIALMVAAAALWVLRRPPAGGLLQFLARLAALSVSILGLVNVSEYLAGFNTGLHHLLFAGKTSPILMPVTARSWPQTGLSLILIGSALLTLHYETRRGKRPAEWFAAGILLISSFALANHVYEAIPLLGAGSWRGMAVHTATAFLLLAVGVLFVHPDRGFMAVILGNSAGSLLLRRPLPAVILIPFLLGVLQIYAERGGLSRPGTSAIIVAMTAVFAAMAWWSARGLKRLEEERNRVMADLRRSRDQLDGKVRERTHELQATIESLREAMIALRFSDERNQSIMDNVLCGIITIDILGIVRSMNAAAERIFGYSAEEVVGRNVTMLMPESFRAGHDESIARYLRTGEARIIGIGREVRGLRRDGVVFPMEIFIGEFGQGDQKLFTGVVRDITERKRAEEAMRRRLELQEQLAMIAESVPGAINTFRRRPDGSSCMPFATPPIEDLYGIPARVLAEDFSPVFANVHPDDVRALEDSEKVALEGGGPWHSKIRYRHPVKGERWIEGWARAQGEVDGSVLWHGFVMDVTDREHAEEGRRESERFASSVLDSLSSSIAVLDASGTILTVNEAWRTFAGEDGCIGHVSECGNYLQVCESVAGEEREMATAFAAGIRDVLAGRRASFELEYPCDSPTRRRWFVGRVTPFRLGGPPRVVVAHEDVTAQKEAERQLREREWLLRQSQRMAHVGSWELDVDDPADLHSGELRWSDECFRIFGYAPGEVAVTRDLFLQAVHPDDRESVDEAFVRAIREDGLYSIEHRISRADGTEGIVFEWGRKIAGSGGRTIRVLGTCQDITERKVAERALSASEERLAIATNSAGLGTWDADLTTGRLVWSTRQEELFGFEPGGFGGTMQDLYGRVHPEDRDGLERAITHARDSRNSYHHEYRIALPEGGIRWIAGYGRHYYDESGTAVRMAGVAQDVTERKQAEEALRGYSRRLEHLREIDRGILSSRSPREIAESALGNLAHLVPHGTGGVVLYDFDRDLVEVITNEGLLRDWYPPGTRLHDHLKDRPEIGALRQGHISGAEEARGMDFTSLLMDALQAAGMQSYMLVPLLNEGRLLGAIFLASGGKEDFSADQLEVAREVGDQLAVAMRQSLLLKELRAAKVRLESLSRQLIRVQEEEQRRIARELHDEVGQNLTAVKIMLNLLVRDPSAPDLGRKLADAAAMTGLALEQVRDLSRLLRPSILDDLGLAEASRALVTGLAERVGLDIEIAVDEIGSVDPEVQTACYRIMQEALTNAAKHAGATRVRVALDRIDGDLDLVIEDDGIGFDVEEATSRAIGGSSLGILGLQERAQLVGGRAEIRSRPGQGTRVHAVVPATGRAGGSHAEGGAE